MKLYVIPGACSLASHIVLLWANAPFELAILSNDGVRAEAYKQINPKGAVPVLAIDEGSPITESLAVLEDVADCFPTARLGADTGNILARARLNEALAELVSDVHGAWAPVFVPDRFVTRPELEVDAKVAAFGQLDTIYRRLDGEMQGRNWRIFDRRTVADAYLYVLCRWKDRSPEPLENYPALAAFKARLDGDPDVQKALEREYLDATQ